MKRISILSLAAAVAAVTFISGGANFASALGVPAQFNQQPPPPPPPPGYGQDRDHDRDREWEGPPQELDEVARHGFHDGIEGARKDFGNHRRPDVHNREEFRHPPVPHQDRQAYRRGFERGYQVGVEHLMGERR